MQRLPDNPEAISPARRYRRGRTALGLALLASAAMLAPSSFEPEPAEASCTQLTLSAGKRAVKRGGRVGVFGGCTVSGSTAVGAGETALIQLRGKGRWRTVARPDVAGDGSFTAAVTVRVSRRTRVAKLRAFSSTAPAAKVRVGVFPACKRSRKCRRKYGRKRASRGLIASDTSVNPDPRPFWGNIDCENASRVQHFTGGGDPTVTGMGRPQGDSAFRRMTVFDGDDYYGERCEVGANNRAGPVTFYREGQRRLTYASFRLPSNFPLAQDGWQGVLQMKQVQPAGNGGGAPVISLSAFSGRWQLYNSIPGYSDNDRRLWSAPARAGVWTRFLLDVTYSRNPNAGAIRISADLNGDGVFDDPGEHSPIYRTNTLKEELGGDPSDGLKDGASIPSHLRVGIYHEQSIPCSPTAGGCAVDVDNVQVIAP